MNDQEIEHRQALDQTSMKRWNKRSTQAAEVALYGPGRHADHGRAIG